MNFIVTNIEIVQLLEDTMYCRKGDVKIYARSFYFITINNIELFFKYFWILRSAY